MTIIKLSLVGALLLAPSAPLCNAHQCEIKSSPLTKLSIFKVYAGTVQEPVSVVSGTAFLIETPKHKRVLITAKHVCEDTKEKMRDVLKVDTLDKWALKLKVSVDDDLCMLDARYIPNKFKPMKLAIDSTLKRNTVAYAIGYPGEESITKNKLSFIIRLTVKGPDWPQDSLVLEGEVRPGQSGGPILNSKNEVIGVTWGYSKLYNKCFAVPLDRLKEFIKGE